MFTRHNGLKTLLIIILAGSGILVGYWMASKDKHSLQSGNLELISKKIIQDINFPLTNFDLKDTIEKPTIAMNDSGKIFLAWASQTSEVEKKLFLAASEDEGKSFQPAKEITRSNIFRSISQSKNKMVSREIRMTPHLAFEDGSLFLAWTESLPDNQSVRMVVSISQDGGNSFGAPLVVHQGDKARATFTSLSVGMDKSIACSWLDNREKVQKPFVSVKDPNMEAFPPEEGIIGGHDGKGVCPCCPTTSLIDKDGNVFVAFRGVVDGYRDFWIARKKAGHAHFEKPVPVVEPTWKFDGCPHDGASILVLNERIHIVWMDARTGSQRCYHAWAGIADLKFTSFELNPISQGSQGNAKIISDINGNIYAVWEESKENQVIQDNDHKNHDKSFEPGAGRIIMAACLSSQSMKFSKGIPLSKKANVFQTRPSMAVSKSGDILVCWNELSENGKSIIIKKLKNNLLLNLGYQE